MIPLTVRDFSFSYPHTDRRIVNDVSFDVHEGEFVSIVGPSGCGKSTLCYACNGIIPHTISGTVGGRIEVFGKDTATHEPHELSAEIGIILQNPETQLFAMTVEEELAFGPENLGIEPCEIERRIDWALSIVRMERYRETFPFHLSGGQKQRVAIAATLTMMPRALILDEPTSQLDPKGKREVFDVIKRLHDEEGMTIMLIEHETDLIAEYAERVMVMDAGRIIMDGVPREVLSKVEFLHKVGVRPPEVAEATFRLHREGLVPAVCTTMHEAREMIW